MVSASQKLRPVSIPRRRATDPESDRRPDPAQCDAAFARLTSSLAQAGDTAALARAAFDESRHVLPWAAMRLAAYAPSEGSPGMRVSAVHLNGETVVFPEDRRELRELGPQVERVLTGEGLLERRDPAGALERAGDFETACRALPSHLWAPLRAGGEVIGFISAHGDQPFTTSDLALLGRIGDSVGPSLQAALSREIGAESGLHLDVSRLNDVAAPEGHALRAVLSHVHELFPRYLGFNRVSLLLYDEERRALVSNSTLDPDFFLFETDLTIQPIGFSISGKAFLEGRPVVVDDCTASDLIPAEYVERYSLRSSVAVPVIIDGRVNGVLRVDDTEKAHGFTPEDVEFISAVAEMLGIIAASPRLYRELRESMESVRESERNFRALAENANDGILIAVEGERLVYANGRAGEILGVEADKLWDLRLSTLVAPEFRTEVRRHFRRVLAGTLEATRQYETQFLRPGDETVPVELSIARTDWRGSPAVLTILRDITVRRRLEKRILDVSESEQRRFGHDLHDGLGQSLAAISIRCKILERRLAARDAAEVEDIAGIRAQVRDTIDETRFLARGLSPIQLEARGLIVALEEMAARIDSLGEVRCRFEGEPKAAVNDRGVATQLYRIAQEAANNALKHAAPSRIDITLQRKGGEILLEISDDGTGLPAGGIGEAAGMGIQIMKYRAATIGASLEIGSKDGGGTTVRCGVRAQEEKR